MAITRTSGSNAGPVAHLVVKSSALPSSTIRSARRIRSGNAPSVASAMPRGLSMITAGAPVAASRLASRARPATFDICGPAMISGRFAPAIAAAILSAAIAPSGVRAGRLALGPADRVFVDPRIEQIGRQAHMHRPRPPRRRDADRLGDVAAERDGVLRGPRRLGDRSRHLGLPQFLKSAAAQFPRRGMSRQQHHRRFRAERREQRADRVGVARAAGDQRDAGLAGEASVRVGHVDCGRLMAHMHEIEACLDRRVEDRHDVVAGQREHAAAAEPRERARNDIRPAQRLPHRNTSGCAFRAAAI